MKLFVIEPRNIDGSLSVKGEFKFAGLPVEGATEDQIFSAFFSAHPGKEWAAWTDIYSWLESNGQKLRIKNW